MMQLIALLSLPAAGLAALVVAHVRRSRRGSARTTAGHLRNVNGPEVYYQRAHARGAASIHQGRVPLRP